MPFMLPDGMAQRWTWETIHRHHPTFVTNQGLYLTRAKPSYGMLFADTEDKQAPPAGPATKPEGIIVLTIVVRDMPGRHNLTGIISM